MKKINILLFVMLAVAAVVSAQQTDVAASIQNRNFDPATLLWYAAPAKVWNDALPVGNGRLGAMVFGTPDNERIQFNEETYWSGGHILR